MIDLGERKELRMRNRSTPIGCYIHHPVKNSAKKVRPLAQKIPVLVPAAC